MHGSRSSPHLSLPVPAEPACQSCGPYCCVQPSLCGEACPAPGGQALGQPSSVHQSQWVKQGSQCRGLKGTVGRAKGVTVQGTLGRSPPRSSLSVRGCSSAIRAEGPPCFQATKGSPHAYLRCLKPCEPSGPSGCRITWLGCLASSGWEILVGLQDESTQSPLTNQACPLHSPPPIQRRQKCSFAILKGPSPCSPASLCLLRRGGRPRLSPAAASERAIQRKMPPKVGAPFSHWQVVSHRDLPSSSRINGATSVRALTSRGSPVHSGWQQPSAAPGGSPALHLLLEPFPGDAAGQADAPLLSHHQPSLGAAGAMRGQRASSQKAPVSSKSKDAPAAT